MKPANSSRFLLRFFPGRSGAKRPRVLPGTPPCLSAAEPRVTAQRTLTEAEGKAGGPPAGKNLLPVFRLLPVTGLASCRCGPKRRLPARAAFTLVEFIGVLAVMGILAAMLIPVVVNETETSAVSTETVNLNTIDNALVFQILHTYQIPGPTNWASTVGSWLMLPTGSITTNAQGYARAYLYDTNGFGAMTLPYIQTNGLASLPGNPRLMIVSCISKALPIASGGMSSNAFTTIWNTTAGTVPSAWSGWTGKGSDLVIQRVNLLPLFDQLILSAVDTNDFGNCVVQSGTTFSATTYVITNAPLNAWFLQGTVIGLYDTNSSPATQNLELSTVMSGDISFVFEDEAWRGQLTGWGTNGPAGWDSTVGTAGSAGSVVTAQNCTWTEKNFRGCRGNSNDHYSGDSCTALAGCFHTFMLDYNSWSDEGFNNSSSGACGRLNNDYDSLYNITQHMCQ